MKLEKVFAMKWASLYPMYVKKAVAKGRNADEVDQVIRWLTGYTPAGLRKQNEGDADLETFFAKAPKYNPNAHARHRGGLRGAGGGRRAPADAPDPAAGQAGG
jgi:hypothetical protein